MDVSENNGFSPKSSILIGIHFGVPLFLETPNTLVGGWTNPFEKYYLERQVSYFFKATLPLKPATITLKIGHLAFQVVKLGIFPNFFRGENSKNHLKVRTT